MDNSNNIVKQMPTAVDAEQALLGSIIIKPEAFDLIGGLVTHEDFYLEEHKHIFQALSHMYQESKTIDPITLVNALIEQGDRDEAGGIQYISLLAESAPTAANAKEYARIVKEKSLLRQLINTCDDINSLAYSEASPVREIIDTAEHRIFKLAHHNDSNDPKHIRDVLQVVFRDLEIKSELKGKTDGIKTGFSDLDNTLVELGKGDLVIVGARPGMGKTSFSLNLAVNAAKSSGKSVAVFSLEMSCEQLATRIISSEAMVESHTLRSGQLKEEDWSSIAEVVTSLSNCEIYLDDTSSMGVNEMKAKMRRIPNLGMVVIDYIGLMQTNAYSDNRAQQVGEISRNLKIMAKDFGIPIICCAQLNRGTEARGNQSKRPSLADLRDSGSIEQDADIVLFLYRDSYYKDISGAQGDAEAAENANVAEIIVAKNRHGSTGNIKVGFISQFTKFRSLENSGRFEG